MPFGPGDRRILGPAHQAADEHENGQAGAGQGRGPLSHLGAQSEEDESRIADENGAGYLIVPPAEAEALLKAPPPGP